MTWMLNVIHGTINANKEHGSLAFGEPNIYLFIIIFLHCFKKSLLETIF